ncbi:hypothetical protein E4U21_006859, partial [Claviceps maximensis]
MSRWMRLIGRVEILMRIRAAARSKRILTKAVTSASWMGASFGFFSSSSDEARGGGGGGGGGAFRFPSTQAQASGRN